MSYRRLKQEDAAQRWVSHTPQSDGAIGLRARDLAGTGRKTRRERKCESAAQFSDGGKARGQSSAIKTLTADNPRQQTAVEQLANLVHAGNCPWAERTEVTGNSSEKQRAAGSNSLVLLAMRQEEERS
jgi:hypothetical protein